MRHLEAHFQRGDGTRLEERKKVLERSLDFLSGCTREVLCENNVLYLVQSLPFFIGLPLAKIVVRLIIST